MEEVNTVASINLAELNSSILNTVKVQLGIPADHTEFDQALQLNINVAFGILNQLGVGPDTPFIVENDSYTWDMFDTDIDMELVKQYVTLKTRELFDPPSGAASEAMTRNLDELTWRLNVAAEKSIDS